MLYKRIPRITRLRFGMALISFPSTIKVDFGVLENITSKVSLSLQSLHTCTCLKRIRYAN